MINVIEDLSCIPGAGLSCNIKDFGLDILPGMRKLLPHGLPVVVAPPLGGASPIWKLVSSGWSSSLGESPSSALLKMGCYRYTLISVVQEVLFQHPCLAPIFSRKIVVGCMLTWWSNG